MCVQAHYTVGNYLNTVGTSVYEWSIQLCWDFQCAPPYLGIPKNAGLKSVHSMCVKAHYIIGTSVHKWSSQFGGDFQSAPS